jgi:hypothetical protein
MTMEMKINILYIIYFPLLYGKVINDETDP